MIRRAEAQAESLHVAFSKNAVWHRDNEPLPEAASARLLGKLLLPCGHKMLDNYSPYATLDPLDASSFCNDGQGKMLGNL